MNPDLVLSIIDSSLKIVLKVMENTPPEEWARMHANNAKAIKFIEDMVDQIQSVFKNQPKP